MGRDSTGAVTTGQALRLELSYLLNARLLKKGHEISGTITWSNVSCISVESNLKDSEYWLRLRYFLIWIEEHKKIQVMKKRVIIPNVRKIVLALVGLEPTTLFNALICWMLEDGNSLL